jgi:hypothetical protein
MGDDGLPGSSRWVAVPYKELHASRRVLLDFGVPRDRREC